MSTKKQKPNTATEGFDSIVAGLLKKPYTRMIIPEDDGTFRAEMLEFPGCIATGDTNTEALSTLEDVAASWIASATAQHQTIPEPIDNHDFSGRMVVRFPRSLHKNAALMAEVDGVSLNQLIITSVAEYIGERFGRRAAVTMGLQTLNFMQMNFNQTVVSSNSYSQIVPNLRLTAIAE